MKRAGESESVCRIYFDEMSQLDGVRTGMKRRECAGMRECRTCFDGTSQLEKISLLKQILLSAWSHYGDDMRRTIDAENICGGGCKIEYDNFCQGECSLKTNLCFLEVFVIASLVLGACGFQVEEPHPVGVAHWAYEGEEGPEHWGEIDPAYAVCGTGTSQSPIDISAPREQDLANIAFHYQPSEMNILNNGHTVQVNYDAGSYIDLDDIRYDVAQFHYHAPSEHAIDGKLFAAEIHIVHKNADGQLAVVGIMLEGGAENSAFAPFINNLPAEKSDAENAGVTVNAADFLPAVQTTFRYSGSLTTPPCTEGVSWLVMTSPIELSAAQLSVLDVLFENNNRPMQELNDRPLVEDSTP